MGRTVARRVGGRPCAPRGALVRSRPLVLNLRDDGRCGAMDGQAASTGRIHRQCDGDGWLSTVGYKTSLRMESRHNVKPPTLPWLIAGGRSAGFIS